MLEINYVLLSLTMIIIIIVGHYMAGKNYFDDKKKLNSNTTKVALFLVGLIGYLAILSFTKVLTDFGLPPRFPIFLVIPLLLFCIYFYIKNRNNEFIQSIPLHWTAFYQSFRILVEFLILYTFMKGIMPVEATFEGYNFDIIMGISAIPIGLLIYKTGHKYKTLLRIWNIVGILMVLFVAVIIATNTYQPQIWGLTEPSVKTEFMQMPYLLLAGFLAPSAIFIHIISLIQLNKTKA